MAARALSGKRSVWSDVGLDKCIMRHIATQLSDNYSGGVARAIVGNHHQIILADRLPVIWTQMGGEGQPRYL